MIISFRALLLALCLCISTSSVFAQCLQFPISVEQRLAMSESMVEGEIISKRSYWDPSGSNIYTAYQIKVYKSWKERPEENIIELILPGGQVDLYKQVNHPNVTYNIGDTGIFLLQKAKDATIEKHKSSVSTYQPVTIEQSRWLYDLNKLEACNAFDQMDIAYGAHYNFLNDVSQSEYLVHEDNPISFRPNEESTDSRSITNFTPTSITAGTNSILTINGSGFGATQGSVEFANPNTGGSTFQPVSSYEILSWNNNQITVEVPTTAGTGSIRVVTDANTTFTSGSTLTVTCAETQVNATQNGSPNSFDSHFGDPIVFQMNEEFYNTEAPTVRSSFATSLNSWACETEVNWTLALEPTAIDVSADDDINLVRFDDGNELPSGALGVATSRYAGCVSGPNVTWFVEEVDIRFNDATNWNFDEGNPSFSEFDFISVATHELGHAQQLAHVIDNNKVMHYAIANGQQNRSITAAEMVCAQNVQDRSVTVQACNTTVSNTECNMSLASALPVDLISFTVAHQQQNALVRWKTATEYNNDYFSIEHSTDARHWTEISKIKAHNHAHAHSYSYLHKGTASGNNYYRLSQTDLDGTKTYYDIQSLYFDAVHDIRLLSNIVNYELILEADLQHNMAYSIYDMTGKTLLSNTLNNGINHIDIASLKPGTHILHLDNGRTFKFVKQ